MSNQSAASRVTASLQELFKSKLDPGNSYIKFELTSNITALLSMEQVQESIIVAAEEITTLPWMPKSAIGMMNSRDRVFCIFDLSQLLAMPSTLTNSRQYQIIVLRTTSEPQINVGFAVNQLQGIVRFLDEDIQLSVEGVPDNFVDCVSGAVQQESRTIPILKLNAIIAALNRS